MTKNKKKPGKAKKLPTKVYPPSKAVMKKVSPKVKKMIKDLKAKKKASPKKTVKKVKVPKKKKTVKGVKKVKVESALIPPINPRPVTEEAINVPVKPERKVMKRPTSTSSVRNYLSKKELLSAVMESKGLGRMSDDLAFKLQLLTDKYARSAQYARYTFNDDMRAYAMMMLVRTWNSFNPEKSDNPFAFYTQCIKNSFIQYLNREKRQRNIRDELLVDQGLTPSYTYQMEYEGSHHSHGEDQTPSEPISHNENRDEHDDVGDE